LLGIGLIIVGFLGYKYYTEAVIRQLESERDKLKVENRRLRAALRGSKYVKDLKLSSEPLDYPATAKIEILKPDERER
jgi:hypothetical protein